MRKILLVLPDLLANPEGESLVRQKLPGLNALAERSELAKLSKLPEVETPEALILGMAPDKVRLAQGPLTIAALGADPPDRSTHFHLSILSVTDSIVEAHKHQLPPEQLDLALEKAKTLNTKALTIVAGQGADHGLVWEGLGDLGTSTPTQAEGKRYQSVLPEGDNEPALRRFIDDSINLLSELEFNAERIDKGLQPINLLWPWGQGVRQRVPNLALTRGEPAMVYSPSLRLAGLTRLAGYRHAERSLLSNGLNAKWQSLAKKALGGTTSIIYSDAFQVLRSEEKLEEAEWLAKEIDTWFIDPVLHDSKETPTRLFIASPSETGIGLAMVCETGVPIDGHFPFDERSLDEKIPMRGLPEWIDRVLSP